MVGMRVNFSIISQFIVSTVAVGLLAGCPGKDGGDGTQGTGTDGSTTDAQATTSEGMAGSSTGVTTTTGVTTSGTSDTTIGTSDTTTGGAEAVCECIAPAEFGGGSFQCATGPCGHLLASCVGGGGDTDTDTDGGDCEPVVDEVKLNCALDLLIGGEAGVVMWVFSPDQGFSEQGGFVQVLPNREGLTRTWSWIDLGGEDSAAGVVPLRPAEYFQGCKDMVDPSAKFLCMRNWSEQQPSAQCDEPGMASDI